jgi:hypothetical protein
MAWTLAGLGRLGGPESLDMQQSTGQLSPLAEAPL